MKSISFNSETIRAIPDGRKTQTRRVIKPQPCDWVEEIHYHEEQKAWELIGYEMGEKTSTYGFPGQLPLKCFYGKVGDRLWVRETWCEEHPIFPTQSTIYYKAKDKLPYKKLKWKSAIHMPRWASRITLEITDIRVERLQEISEEDAIKEGSPFGFPDVVIGSHTNIELFVGVWESLSKKGFKWDDNCWVWVIGFKRVEQKTGGVS